MLDIRLIRENPEVVREDLKKRGETEKLKLLDKIIADDNLWREKISETNELKRQRNVVNQEIGTLKKEGKDAKGKLDKADLLAKKITNNEKEIDELQVKIRKNLMGIPNILHESVPVGKDETGNVEIRKWGDIPKFDFEPNLH